jgi:hypothetical protein
MHAPGAGRIFLKQAMHNQLEMRFANLSADKK